MSFRLVELLQDDRACAAVSAEKPGRVDEHQSAGPRNEKRGGSAVLRILFNV